ncbi:hypothetical protein EDB89DRAFT_1957734 [Lactarius sanguifluus]|nr:hypothetical protein EDB89DRAFT_2045576 [Lactarius sanguifluus]KAH9173789.1 hypothetical protein EDB89DRAFT_1957734 [Lactarius sanguifluus]
MSRLENKILGVILTSGAVAGALTQVVRRSSLPACLCMWSGNCIMRASRTVGAAVRFDSDKFRHICLQLECERPWMGPVRPQLLAMAASPHVDAVQADAGGSFLHICR